MIVQDPSDPTNNSMTLYYDPAYSGFRFKNNKRGDYIYFSVLDPYGNLKNFQFNHSQVYNNIKFYQDGIFNQGMNQAFWQGDVNSDQGAYFIYIPSTNPTDGWVFRNRGVPNNGLVFYTNFVNSDANGNETQTLRMNYGNIWSKVKHTFEMDSVFNGASTFNNSFNAQTGNFSSSLQVNGNTLTSSLTCSNNATIQGNLTVSGASANNIAGLTTFSGSTTVSNTLQCE